MLLNIHLERWLQLLQKKKSSFKATIRIYHWDYICLIGPFINILFINIHWSFCSEWSKCTLCFKTLCWKWYFYWHFPVFISEVKGLKTYLTCEKLCDTTAGALAEVLPAFPIPLLSVHTGVQFWHKYWKNSVCSYHPWPILAMSYFQKCNELWQ